MATRLPYETQAGYFSESATIAQVTEYLRLAAEGCYSIGHNRKANDDMMIGQGFLAIGQMLEETNRNITNLIVKSTRLKQ